MASNNRMVTVKRVKGIGLVGVAMMVWAMSVSALAAEQSFEQWLQAFKEEAATQGISQRTLDTAFVGVEPIPRIIELDRKQPEFTLTLQQYLERVVPQRRIDIGRQRLAENHALLKEVSAKYGVPERFIVAFWGVETDFGRISGGYNVVAALSTLAYDGRRGPFFRKQLIYALEILDQEHVALKDMMGSWAGAMGHTQFMPSTFRAYAIDFDGDGHKNIWQSKADAFGSAANYLKSVGWNSDLTWGRPVKLPKGFDASQVDRENFKSLADWQTLGVRRMNGEALPALDIRAAMIQPDGEGTQAYLIYDNFKVIRHWNKSDKFAIAVGTLADSLR